MPFEARLETVKEDAIEVWLFPRALDTAGTLFGLEELLAQINVIVSELTRQHIWHKDSFNIFLPVIENEELPPHLYSLTHYGDNIEDEWLIVFLLLELSRRLPGLVAQVRDNDGEFLLIEAADALPAWATPVSTQNRVFIKDGNVHLVPPTLIDVNKTISIKEALQYVQNNPTSTKAAISIQTAIQKRLHGFPQRIADNLHRATVHIPTKYAAILKIEPSLIAQAVNAYCSRDNIETNICKKVVLENCIDNTVVFTKCLYAMLTHSKIINKTNWKLPAKSSNDYKKCMLGAKIACGFEILISKASQDTFASKQWQVYLESLKKNGYFRENIEGSNGYMTLLNAAKNYFLSIECPNINAYIGDKIKNITDTTEFEHINLTIADTQITDEVDSDGWLNINPEELNDLMTERYGKKVSFPNEDIITPQTITNHLTNFLKQSSDVEGIELQNIDENETTNSSEDRIEFDFDQFTEKVKNILDLVVPEDDWNLDSGTDLSEYGSDDDLMEDINCADEYQQTMEKELSNSTMSQSFIKDGETVDVSKNTFVNLLHSVKEEKGSSGPSSHVLASIGFTKQQVQPLDSDDDEA